MTSVTPAPKRLDYLDGLRGIACLIVALSHFVDIYDFGLVTGSDVDSHFGFEKYIAGSPLNLPIAGEFMVQIFFVLSGFVLIKAFLGNSTFLGALIRRYVRLTFPVLATCLVAWSLIYFGLNYVHPVLRETHSTFMGGAASYRPPHVYFGDLLHQAFYSSVFGHYVDSFIGPVIWTLPVEFSGSVLLILFVALSRTWKIPAFLILFLLSVLCWGYFQFFMMCGACLFLLNERNLLQGLFGKGRPWIWIVMVFFIIAYGSYPRTETPGVFYRALTFDREQFFDFSFQSLFHFTPYDRFGLFNGIAAILVVVSAITSEHFQGFLRRFEFFGRISFPLYLIHIPVIYACGGLFLLFAKLFHNKTLAVAITFPLTVGLSLFSAWLMYLWVEKPAVQFSKKVGAWVDNSLAGVL